jgi:hypothetical protein
LSISDRDRPGSHEFSASVLDVPFVVRAALPFPLSRIAPIDRNSTNEAANTVNRVAGFLDFVRFRRRVSDGRSGRLFRREPPVPSLPEGGLEPSGGFASLTRLRRAASEEMTTIVM